MQAKTHDLARAALLVALSALLAHAPVLWAGFVWLDHAHIGDGLATLPASDLGRAFREGFAGTGYYRPLMALSLSLDRLVSAGPFVFHLVTLLWHAFASVLVLATARGFGVPLANALFAGLLFAVHPANSLVAGAIAFRSEAMAAVAVLTVVIAHQRRQSWLAALALLVAGLSKETALLLGPMFLALLSLELYLRTPSEQRRRLVRARLRFFVAPAIAVTTAVALRLSFAPSWRARWPLLGADEQVGTRLAALGKSTLLALAPFPTRICDDFPTSTLFTPLSGLGLVVLTALVVKAFRRSGPWRLLLLSVLPALQLVPVMRWWSPHYLYIPLAFALMLGADACARLRRPAPVLTAAVLILAGASFITAFRYRDDRSLWQPEIADKPTCREGQFFMAEAMRAEGKLDAAVTHYRLALQETPGRLAYVDRQAAHQNLGAVLLAKRDLTGAATAFTAARALTEDPGEQRRLDYNRAVVAFMAGQYREVLLILAAEVQRADALPQARALAADAERQLRR